mmetsp:Transcript_74754/g.217000  ORF Transcript_74754/g.217000 Transcript_74754/m.217000 type:complete len:216 (+) Transcript_74754:793-1440(+)
MQQHESFRVQPSRRLALRVARALRRSAGSPKARRSTSKPRAPRSIAGQGAPLRWHRSRSGRRSGRAAFRVRSSRGRRRRESGRRQAIGATAAGAHRRRTWMLPAEQRGHVQHRRSAVTVRSAGQASSKCSALCAASITASGIAACDTASCEPRKQLVGASVGFGTSGAGPVAVSRAGGGNRGFGAVAARPEVAAVVVIDHCLGCGAGKQRRQDWR